jgi:hypothetical protein
LTFQRPPNQQITFNQDEYNDKISQLLDPEQYTKLKKDPTPTIERRTREIIKQSSIPRQEQRPLLPSSTRPPRLYGPPKIHKEECPLRPIVSTMGSPTYNLAKYLAKHLQTYVRRTHRFFRKKLITFRSINQECEIGHYRYLGQLRCSFLVHQRTRRRLGRDNQTRI